MASYNRIILMGNLTDDPQVRPSKSGDMQLCDFRLAVNSNRGGRDRAANTAAGNAPGQSGGGRERDPAELYIDVRAFGKAAELIGQYLRKGRGIFVEGRLVLESWTSQDGQPRSKHRVLLDSFQFLGDGQRDGTRDMARDSPRDGYRDSARENPPRDTGRDSGPPVGYDDEPPEYSAASSGQGGYGGRGYGGRGGPSRPDSVGRADTNRYDSPPNGGANPGRGGQPARRPSHANPSHAAGPDGENFAEDGPSEEQIPF